MSSDAAGLVIWVCTVAPTSCDNALALIALGPAIRGTTREWNASLYSGTLVPHLASLL